MGVGPLSGGPEEYFRVGKRDVGPAGDDFEPAGYQSFHLPPRNQPRSRRRNEYLGPSALNLPIYFFERKQIGRVSACRYLLWRNASARTVRWRRCPGGEKKCVHAAGRDTERVIALRSALVEAV